MAQTPSRAKPDSRFGSSQQHLGILLLVAFFFLPSCLTQIPATSLSLSLCPCEFVLRSKLERRG